MKTLYFHMIKLRPTKNFSTKPYFGKLILKSSRSSTNNLEILLDIHFLNPNYVSLHLLMTKIFSSNSLIRFNNPLWTNLLNGKVTVSINLRLIRHTPSNINHQFRIEFMTFRIYWACVIIHTIWGTQWRSKSLFSINNQLLTIKVGPKDQNLCIGIFLDWPNTPIVWHIKGGMEFIIIVVASLLLCKGRRPNREWFIQFKYGLNKII